MKFRQIRTRTCRVSESGQSLIEVVIAIGVILSVLISIAGLVAINIFGQKKSENKTIASNLAREGIEVFRNMRDTQKLMKAPLESFSQDGISHYWYIQLNTANNTWSFLSCASPCDWTAILNRVLFDIVNNIYNTVSGFYTPFRRRILVDSMCKETVPPDPPECTNGIKEDMETCACNVIGFRVTSEVQWTENTQTQTVKLVDFLYNWR